MSFSRVHFSSITVEHATPQALFDHYNAEYRFDLDAAARGRDETADEFFARKLRMAKAAIEKGAEERKVLRALRKLKPFTRNNKCARYFSEEVSAFNHPWRGKHGAARVWCNPPYGRGLERWIARGRDQLIKGHAEFVVWLLPARTDTRWFHRWFWDSKTNRPKAGVEVQFLRGRVKFGEATSGAPFPSMIVIDRRLRRF